MRWARYVANKINAYLSAVISHTNPEDGDGGGLGNVGP
jgi:hypothetical protein